MRSKFAWISSLTILLIIVSIGISIVIFTKQATVHADTRAMPPLPHGISSQSIRTKRVIGIPAIVPQANASNKSNSANSTAPRIKVSDVQTFIKVHPFQGGVAVPGTKPKLAAIDLITSKEASQRLHDTYIGLSDNALVYYVEWQGPFNVVNASIPQGVTPKPAAKGVEIFDTTTGNLLLWWVPNV
jgi:hypothetical protein